MTINSWIKAAALRQSVVIERVSVGHELSHFFARFRENYLSLDLIRVGGEGDGGYLLPDNLSTIRYCFSPGVGQTAHFESELSRNYGIRSFMADGSVSASPVQDPNFEFQQRFLGARTHGHTITLSDWVRQSVPEENAGMLLQMDIEGGEYEVLAYESAQSLSRFSTMIIEFHGVHHLFEQHFLRMFSGIFEKIYENFTICHVHPNNCHHVSRMGDFEIPGILEITFLRNDQVSQFLNKSEVNLPHPLDRPNDANHPELRMPDIWWKRQ